MTAYRVYDIMCDFCDNVLGACATTAVEARAVADDEGWKRVRVRSVMKDRCAQCVATDS